MRLTMDTRLTALLGCRYPIIQTAMGWVADPNLVAGSWTTNGVALLGSGVLDAEFNTVTNRVSTEVEDEQFIRLIIE